MFPSQNKEIGREEAMNGVIILILWEETNSLRLSYWQCQEMEDWNKI